MSWFRRSPHPREEEKRHPQHPVKDDLRKEIKENQQRLAEFKRQVNKETKDGKLH